MQGNLGYRFLSDDDPDDDFILPNNWVFGEGNSAKAAWKINRINLKNNFEKAQRNMADYIEQANSLFEDQQKLSKKTENLKNLNNNERGATERELLELQNYIAFVNTQDKNLNNLENKKKILEKQFFETS